MSGSEFRSTFTKEQRGEPLLSYDNYAALFFFSSILFIILSILTWLQIRVYIYKVDDKKNYEKKNNEISCQCNLCKSKKEIDKKNITSKYTQKYSTLYRILLVILWLILAIIIRYILENPTEIKGFNPYKILDIRESSVPSSFFSGEKNEENAEFLKMVKKKFRVTSLRYHPDKNPNDPAAQAHFLLVTKAYQTLTNLASRQNYELYGNPDGPSTMKIGIGLPRFLIEEKYQFIILILFFSVFLLFVPILFYYLFQKITKTNSLGIKWETIVSINGILQRDKRFSDFLHLLACISESKMESQIVQNEKEEIQALNNIERELNLVNAISNEDIYKYKNYMILVAHVNRRHDLLNIDLSNRLSYILRLIPRITFTIVDICISRNLITTAENCIDSYRCILQALDRKGSTLLQIPHVDEQIAKKLLRGKKPIKHLNDFIDTKLDNIKGFESLTPEEYHDVRSFIDYLCPVYIKSAKGFVEGEETITTNDIVTISITLSRYKLEDGAVIGMAHSHFSPINSHEYTWIFVRYRDNNEMIHHEKLKIMSNNYLHKIKLQARHSGKIHIVITAKSDIYHGLDSSISLSISVNPKSEDTHTVVNDEEYTPRKNIIFEQIQQFTKGETSSDDEELMEYQARTGHLKKIKDIIPNKDDDDDDDDDDNTDT